VGPRREDAAKLTDSPNPRGWPLVVRRVREEDRAAVLGFATETWNGWDYIPNAWPVWVDANDGAFLVATVGEPLAGAGGSGPAGLVDAEGKTLSVGQPIAITRVAMPSPTEAWLEGIRVDPRVRAMGVAGDLQVAELQWVAAQGARVVRYATSASNEASHRLGGRDGINLIARFRSWLWSATGKADEEDDPSAFDADVREAATERRRRALALLRDAGMLLNAERDDVADTWNRLNDDPTFAAGQRLYEPRAWAMQELTEELFRSHVERGEVIVGKDDSREDGFAVAVLVGEQLPSEDSSLRLAVFCGDGTTAAALLDRIHRTVDDQIRLRIPTGAPMVHGHEEEFAAAGFVSPEDWELHILARQMANDSPIPAVDPARLVLAERPIRISPTSMDP
jgi:hypothetical protein